MHDDNQELYIVTFQICLYYFLTTTLYQNLCIESISSMIILDDFLRHRHNDVMIFFVFISGKLSLSSMHKKVITVLKKGLLNVAVTKRRDHSLTILYTRAHIINKNSYELFFRYQYNVPKFHTKIKISHPKPGLRKYICV